MSATDTHLEKVPEPSPRPTDRRYRWNGRFWEALRFLGLRLVIHVGTTNKEKPHVAVVIAHAGAQMTGNPCADPDAAAADALRLARLMVIYIADRTISDDEEVDDIPF